MKDPGSPSAWDDAFSRLEALAGQDPGFFVLAAHSLVEAWLNAVHPEFESGDPDSRDSSPIGFKAKVGRHLEALDYPDYSEALRRFARTYGSTNEVRHRFAVLPEPMAKAVGENLIVLTTKAGLGTGGGRSRMESRVQSWEAHIDRRVHDDALARLRYLEEAQAESGAAFQSRLLELAALEKSNESLKREYEALAAANAQLSVLAAGRKDEYRELKRELFDRKEALRKTEAALASQGVAADYLAELRAMHQASRTRLEYEQTLVRLSAEQEGILHSYRPGESFLVRGAAGTGKTLVLLAAIRKLRDEEGESLAVLPARRVMLITYTKTLTRYSRYLSGLLLKEGAIDDIRTLDSLILELGRALLGPGIRLAFSEEEKASVFAGASDEERAEIEDFIWAGGYGRDSYLDPSTTRVGRKRPIPKADRVKAWERGAAILEAMEGSGLYSFNGLRAAILRRIEAGASIPSAFLQDVVAVDEVQDLAPIDLRILSRLSPSLLMAGDAGQRIIKQGFSFQALGIDVVNRSRTLTRNFRNTRPIHELASGFLAALGLPSAEATSCEAYRDGLPPRLFRYEERSSIHALLADSLRFYREVLEYDESSIAILASGFNREELDGLAKGLRSSGHRCVPIHDEEAWIDKEGIRLSSIHSAKGLDFPVVVALFGKFAEDWSADDETRRRAKANLAYVGLTRALENLTVIMPEKTGDHVLCAIAAAFGRQDRAPSGPQSK